MIIKLNVKFYFLKVKILLKLDGNFLELDFFFRINIVLFRIKKIIKKINNLKWNLIVKNVCKYFYKYGWVIKRFFNKWNLWNLLIICE